MVEHRPGRKRPRGEDITESFLSNHHGTGSYLKITLTGGKTLKSCGWPWVQTGLRTILGKDKVDKASFLRDGSLLVKTKDSAQSEKLLSTDHFMGEACEITRDSRLNSSRGTIRAFDLQYLSDEDIVRWLGEFGVVKARHFTRWVNGKAEPTPNILLTFDMPSCPDKIQLDYVMYEVRKFIPNPLMCLNCGLYGHREDKCTKPKRCLECGETVHEGNCTQKCLSCGSSEHSCRSRKCPRWLKEKEICTLKVEQEVSYAEARRIYESTHKPPPLLNSFSEVVRIPSLSEAREESALRDKVDRLERKLDNMTKLEKKLDDMVTLVTKLAQHLKLPVETEAANSSETQERQDITVVHTRHAVETNPNTKKALAPPSEKVTAPKVNPVKKTDMQASKSKTGNSMQGMISDNAISINDADDHDDAEMVSQVIFRRGRSLDIGGKKPGSFPASKQSWK